MKYQIFNLSVESQFELSGLQPVHESAGKPDIRLEKGSRPDPHSYIKVHDWLAPTGSIIMSNYRRDGEYLLVFPRQAEFRIVPDLGLVQAFALNGCSTATLAHLAVDQVIPRLLGHRGRVVLHASAIRLNAGFAFAFLGDSGRGKSTLAARFYQSGLTVLTDDCLLLERRGQNVTGIPAYPSLRLWPESAAALFSDTSRFESARHYSNKRQLLLKESGKLSGNSSPLSAMFILAPPPDATDEVLIEEVSGAAVAMAMIEAAFVLDVDSRDCVSDSFGATSELANSGLSFFRLSYPRHFGVLPEVQEKVLECLRA